MTPSESENQENKDHEKTGSSNINSQNNNLVKGDPIRSWNDILSILLVSGIVIILCEPCIHCMFPKISIHLESYNVVKVLGIFFLSIPLTHWIVFNILSFLRVLFDLKSNENKENFWPPALLGVCESIIYPVSFIIGYPEFIGFWILLKVAGQWPRWGVGEENKLPDVLDEGRRRYYLFLIGNALVLMLAMLSYGFMKIFAVS